MTATLGRSEDLWPILEAWIDGDPQKRFETFVRRTSEKAWFIGADYVISDENRPSDCMCFTIYPVYEKDHSRDWRDIPKILKKDIKHTKTVDQKMASCLRDDRRFSLCLAITKERHTNVNRKVTKAVIDRNIAKAPNDADRHGEYIAHMRELRQSAEANSFKDRLIADISLVTNIATVIAYLLTKWTSPRIVRWFSDRDAMTTAYEKIANDLFEMSYSAICRQRGVESRGVELSVGDPRVALVPIPDYLAGTVATFSYPKGTFVGGKQKVQDMITKVLADASNISIIALERDGDRMIAAYVNIIKKADAPTDEAQGNAP